jgi:hypothetical protein
MTLASLPERATQTGGKRNGNLRDKQELEATLVMYSVCFAS